MKLFKLNEKLVLENHNFQGKKKIQEPLLEVCLLALVVIFCHENCQLLFVVLIKKIIVFYL
jgi:hypothetical protein